MQDAAALTRQLAEIARENDLAELEFQQGETRIHIIIEPERPLAPMAPAAIPVAPVALEQAVSPAPVVAPPQAPDKPSGETIDSPLPGVFYRAPRPGAPNFVDEGQRVGPSDTLCIVEAMKLMNEISAEKPCTIVKVLVSNGDAIEEGQPLFLIDT